MCLGVFIELWVDEKTLQILCVELKYFRALQTFKVSVTLFTVKSKGFTKEDTC